MKKNLRHWGWAAVLAAVLAIPSGARAAAEFSYGIGGYTWDSNLNQSGFETLVPLAFKVGDAAGKFQFRTSTAFVMGRYKIDTAAVSSQFDGNRLSDTTMGLDLLTALGGLDFSLALSANLPTGDEKWENYESPGNVPILFVPSRYRGRGFGLNALAGLGKTLGSRWNLTLSGGYLYTDKVDPGYVGIEEVDFGSSAVGILALSRRTSGSFIRFRALQTLPDDSEVDGTAVFTAPPATTLSMRWQKGKNSKIGLESAFTLYGKANRLDAEGVLAKEAEKSFGSRLVLNPWVEYGVGAKVRMTTGMRVKKIFTNDKPTTSPQFEGGGYLVGGEQTLKWQMKGGFYTRYSLGYDRIQHSQAAYDLSMNLTAVTYDTVSFGTGMGYQW